MSLPFLVVHGAVVAKLLIASFGLAGVVTALVLRRRRERRLSRELVDRVCMTTGLVAGPVTLRGMLIGRATTTAADLPVHERDPDAVLDVAGEQVELVGDLEVVRGTAASLVRRCRVFSVGPGDDVVARGTLVGAAGAWQLRPSAGSTAVEITAMAPAIQPPAIAPVRLLAVLVGSLLAGYGVLHAVGTAMAKRADHGAADDKRTGSTIDTSLELAAALPGSRGDALDHLAYQLEYEWPQDERTMALRYAAEELSSGCAARADLQIRTNHVADALDCPAARAEASLLLGRYAEAAALLPVSTAPQTNDVLDRTVVAAIGAGRWSDAAAQAEAAAGWPWQAMSGADEDVIVKRKRDQLACLGAWFRIKAGDAAAAARLAQLAAEPTTATTCLVLQALQLPAADRLAALTAAAKRNERYDSGDLVADDLAWAEGTDDGELVLWNMISSLTGRSRSRRLWLVPANPARLGAQGVAATRAIVFGDFARARATLAAARQAMKDGRVTSDLDALEAAMSIRTPATQLPALDPERQWAYEDVAAEVALRTKTTPAKLELDSYRCKGALIAATIAAAHTQDGGDLAHLMVRCSVYDNAYGAFMAIAPLVTAHRDELAAAFRLYSGDHRAEDPFETVFALAQRRDLARLIGDEATAASAQAVIDAHAPVLADHDKVIALMLWHVL